MDFTTSTALAAKFLLAALLPLAQIGLTSLIFGPRGQVFTLANQLLLGLGMTMLALAAGAFVTINIHATFAGLMVIGAVGFLYRLARKPRQTSIIPLSLIIATSAAIAFLFFGKTVFFNSIDDVAGYLPAIENIRQNGTLPFDPFNQNRLAVGLPGGLMMQAVAANLFGSLHFVNYFEHVTASLFLVLWIAERSENAASALLRCAALLLVVLTGVAGFFGYTLASNLLLAAFLVLFADLLSNALSSFGIAGRSQWISMIAATALAGASAMAVKSLAPPFLGVLVILVLIKHRSDLPRIGWPPLAKTAFATSVAILLLLLPMGIQQNASVGTWYFPLSGSGYYVSSYENAPFIMAGWLPRLTTIAPKLLDLQPLTSLLATLAIVTFPATRSLSSSFAWIVSILLVLAMSVLLAAASGMPTNGYRYVYPLLLATLVFGMLNARAKPGQFLMRLAAAAAVSFWLSEAPSFQELKDRAESNAHFLLTDDFNGAASLAARNYGDHLFDLDNLQEHAAAKAIQDAIPEGASIMTAMNNPSMLDFKRNRVFAPGNCPGLLSPPPGIPLFRKDGDLASYLAKYDIHYAIVETAYVQDTSNYARWAGLDDHPWGRMCGLGGLAYREQLPAAGHAIADNHTLRAVEIVRSKERLIR